MPHPHHLFLSHANHCTERERERERYGSDYSQPYLRFFCSQFQKLILTNLGLDMALPFVSALIPETSSSSPSSEQSKLHEQKRGHKQSSWYFKTHLKPNHRGKHVYNNVKDCQKDMVHRYNDNNIVRTCIDSSTSIPFTFKFFGKKNLERNRIDDSLFYHT